MMTVEQIKSALQDRRLQIVADATGMHYNTLKYIRDGVSTDLKHETVAKLSIYLECCQGRKQQS